VGTTELRIVSHIERNSATVIRVHWMRVATQDASFEEITDGSATNAYDRISLAI
jgi:hypothetical protein